MIYLSGRKRFVLRVFDRAIASSSRLRELEAYLLFAFAADLLVDVTIVDRWTGGVLLKREVMT